MQVEWYGQSAFRLERGGDDGGDRPVRRHVRAAKGSGLQWEYPAIEGLEADLLLVTHEHRDHNVVEAVGGDPVVLRSTAGTLDSPLGDVVAVASEHDEAAGTERGPNTIFAFELDGVRVCHMGDFGQSGAARRAGGGARGDRAADRAGRRRSDDRRRTAHARWSSACARAGSCRCTTALRRSGSSRRPTSSSASTRM